MDDLGTQILQRADVEDVVSLLVLDHLCQFVVVQNESVLSCVACVLSLEWSILGIQFEDAAVIEFSDQFGAAFVFGLVQRWKFYVGGVKLGSR